MGATVNAGIQFYRAEGTAAERVAQIDKGEVAVAAVAGGLSGGVSAVAATARTVVGEVVANVLGNAGVGAAATQANAQINGETASVSEVIEGASTSAAAAGVGQAIRSMPGVLNRAASAGMSDTQRTAMRNFFGGIRDATPGFSRANPVQSTANAAGTAASVSVEVAGSADKKKQE